MKGSMWTGYSKVYGLNHGQMDLRAKGLTPTGKSKANGWSRFQMAQVTRAHIRLAGKSRDLANSLSDVLAFICPSSSLTFAMYFGRWQEMGAMD